MTLAALLATKRRAPLRIREFSASVVLSVLRWIYTEQLVYREQDFQDVLLFACKFCMSPLVTVLVQGMTVNTDTIWTSLSLAVKHECKLLLDKCHAFFAPRAEQLLDSPEFLNQSVDVVTAITIMDPLDISEHDLWCRCTFWSGAECERRRLEDTLTNNRAVMQSFVKNINFTDMSMEQLADLRDERQYLSDQELLQVYRCMGDRRVAYPFSSNVRRRS